MKQLILFILVMIYAVVLPAQEKSFLEKGTVSYISGSNIYVKFVSTDAITLGDTLFRKVDSRWIPSLVVQQKSSISCVCTLLESEKPVVGAEYFLLEKRLVDLPDKPKVEITEKEVTSPAEPTSPPVIAAGDTSDDLEAGVQDYKQKITGRISAATYSTLSATEPNHRMRYAFSLRGDHINNSKFSAETYITFRHTIGEWNEVTDNVYDALKIFTLAVRYEPTRNASIILGRRINPRISSMGAVDGLQYEQAVGKFQFGVLAGSRPNFQDFRIDPNLFQAGAYIGYATQNQGISQMNTLALIEQRNMGQIDRRFIYFQHTDNLWKDLNVFASFEVDLYQKVNNEVANTMSLTNLFISLRYRFSRKFSMSVSYDNRKNVIFFESFKNYIDQLIDEETRQGLRFNISYRPFKLISWGANASWRFQKSNTNNSRNFNTYVTVSRVPVIHGSVSFNANMLQTNFLDSKLFGVRYTRDLIKGKLNGDIYYRWVDYQYKQFEYKTHQDIGGVSLNWSITRKLGLYLYYEGAFDKRYDTISRYNTKLIYRI